MGKWIALLALLALPSAAAGADYVLDRRAAVALVAAGKHDDALAAFLKLAESGTTPVQKSDALHQAALCADRLKQYDRALELAATIPLAPESKLCTMHLLDSARRWQELVDRFGGEDFDDWPESLKGDASLHRAYAHFVLKNGPAAEKDYLRAAEFTTNANAKGLCLNQLGDVYRVLLKDDQRAIATYRRTYATGTIYKQCQAAISVADILAGRQQWEAALLELAKIDLDQATAPFWRGRMLCAQGRALAGAGRKAEAIARHKQALALDKLPAEVARECEQALKELSGDGL